MILLLTDQAMSARELSLALRVSMKEVPGHLIHVARTVRPARRLCITPAVCHACGFVFADRKRFSTPSRCPKCRHEGISEPFFSIVEG